MACDSGGPEEVHLDRFATAILTIFLGGFGVHKVSLNKPLIAGVSLCLVWTLIPIFPGIFERCIYLVTAGKGPHRKQVVNACGDT